MVEIVDVKSVDPKNKNIYFMKNIKNVKKP